MFSYSRDFVTALFILGTVISAVKGFFVGFVVGFLLMLAYLRKSQPHSKFIKKALLGGVVLGCICSVLLLPVFRTLNLNRDQQADKDFQRIKEEYVDNLLKNYYVTDIPAKKGKYEVTYSVPETDEYIVSVLVYQESELIARLPIQEITLQKGENVLVAPTEVQAIDTALPVDYEVSVWKKNDSLLNTPKKPVVTNYGEIEIYNGVKYYSPGLKTETHDPCQFDLKYVCKANASLRVYPQ